MTRSEQSRNHRGFFAVGIYRPKTEANVGSLLRTAYLYDAAYVFTVGRRYRPQASDTPRTPRHIPLFHFETIDDAVNHLPDSCPLVGVELDPRGQRVDRFQHPERAAYLLGAEDAGLPSHVRDMCHALIEIPTPQPQSMNVAVAGSIVIYDRHVKSERLVVAS
uniref:RNA methyltransferase n=1 Tax=Microbacterium proteolyticum TaxID=1572644 RepID=UPI0024177CDE|nr:RNA methyltransferase [Microbacterium proteolyticum]